MRFVRLSVYDYQPFGFFCGVHVRMFGVAGRSLTAFGENLRERFAYLILPA